MTSGHILIERLDGIRTRELTELLVHIVRSGTGVVTDPDTEVLDFERFLLVDLRKQVVSLACVGFLQPKR